LGLIQSSADLEALASTVTDNGGVYFVPAFSGLFAPYWRNYARGGIVGMTSYTTKRHIARALLEGTAWQTREVLDAMREEAQLNLTALKVDSGMVYNNLTDAISKRCVRCASDSVDYHKYKLDPFFHKEKVL
jgi:glycerol kinase